MRGSGRMVHGRTITKAIWLRVKKMVEEFTKTSMAPTRATGAMISAAARVPIRLLTGMCIPEAGKTIQKMAWAYLGRRQGRNIMEIGRKVQKPGMELIRTA